MFIMSILLLIDTHFIFESFSIPEMFNTGGFIISVFRPLFILKNV